MAPNDMLLIASCAPHAVPRTARKAECPAHLGVSQVLWKVGRSGVCLKAGLQAQPEVWGSEGQI